MAETMNSFEMPTGIGGNMKGLPKTFHFVPASTRAALLKLDASVKGRYASLPPFELEGEVGWHADLLRWHTKDIAGRAYLLPQENRDACLERERVRLQESGEFTLAETETVIQLARSALAVAHEDQVTQDEWESYQDSLVQSWDDLTQRLAKIMLAAGKS